MLKQVIEMIELLDDSAVNGEKVKDFLTKRGLEDISIKEIKGKTGKTDFIKIVIPGKNGKIKGGDCPTLGIIGRLGGIG
ncbi:DUF1177 family protein, partial [Tepidanaerobacter syntrophicus]